MLLTFKKITMLTILNFPLRNNIEYQRAFVEYEIMMHSTKEPETKELKQLEERIRNYESETGHSSEGINHGEILFYLIRKFDLNQRELATILDVSQPLVNRILNDNVTISRKMARKLSEHFHIGRSLFEMESVDKPKIKRERF